MSKDNDAFGPLPKKPAAAFHHPIGFELYDALAMDLHAMKYAEQCVKAEREACAITTSSLKISPQCLAVTANRAVVCPILSGYLAARKPAWILERFGSIGQQQTKFKPACRPVVAVAALVVEQQVESQVEVHAEVSVLVMREA